MNIKKIPQQSIKTIKGIKLCIAAIQLNLLIKVIKNLLTLLHSLRSFSNCFNRSTLLLITIILLIAYLKIVVTALVQGESAFLSQCFMSLSLLLL